MTLNLLGDDVMLFARIPVHAFDIVFFNQMKINSLLDVDSITEWALCVAFVVVQLIVLVQLAQRHKCLVTLTTHIIACIEVHPLVDTKIHLPCTDVGT